MLTESFIKSPVPYFLAVPVLAFVMVNMTEKPKENVNVNKQITSTVYKLPTKYPKMKQELGSVEHFVDVHAVAEALYFESRGESLDGQELVANVILNRVNSKYFPNSPLEVIYQPYQFSYTLETNLSKSDTKAWNNALNVAKKVMSPDYKLKTKALYYYNPKKVKVTPSWVTPKYYIKTVGNHKFYKWHKNA